MEKFTSLHSVVVPLNRANVDTDAIIPKQFLKSICRAGFGPYLFDEWRYEDKGEPGMDCTNRPRRADFVLNQARYVGGEILLAQQNFGCGSSREHAPWALADYGFKVILAPSFADIFFNNCFKNGLLPICLPEAKIQYLFSEVEHALGYSLTVDLASQTIRTPAGEIWSFDVDAFRKECLLNGWDDIGLTLRHEADIHGFEKHYHAQFPWLQ
jgi:3-isopropylmalate/(R)-2-methylmalate dehydratase small subunit